MTAAQQKQMDGLIAAHEESLLRYAVRLTGDVDKAQGVVEEAFTRLFRAWDGRQTPSPHIRSWLFRVVHKRALALARRRGSLRVVATTTGKGDAWALMNADERNQLLMVGIDSLPPAMRQVVLLRMEAGLGCQEVSEVIGRSSDHVARLLTAGMKLLMRDIAAVGGAQ